MFEKIKIWIDKIKSNINNNKHQYKLFGVITYERERKRENKNGKR